MKKESPYLSSLPKINFSKNSLYARKHTKWLLSFLCLTLCIVSFFIFLKADKIKLGNHFFDNGTFYAPSIAAALYKGAIYFDTKNEIPPVFANYQLGRIHFLRGEFDTALFYLEEEKKYHPENKKVYYMLGLTNGYMEKYRTAIDSFRIYNAREPGSWAGKNDEAWLHFKIGDLEGARSLVEPLYQQGNYSPWILLTYGVILLNQNECEASSLILSIAYDSSLTLTNESFGRAYPGNNPKDHERGLNEMRKTIQNNQKLAKECVSLSSVEKK